MIAEVVPLAQISSSICEPKPRSIRQAERGQGRLRFQQRDQQQNKESRTFRTPRVYTRPNAKGYRIARLTKVTRRGLRYGSQGQEWANLPAPLTRWVFAG